MKPSTMAWSVVLILCLQISSPPACKAQDSSALQIATVEGPQSPNHQGLDPYAIPEIMKLLHVPGVSIAVERDFRLRWTKAYGTADVATGKETTPETLFQAASISKPVTAFAVLRAVDAGKAFSR